MLTEYNLPQWLAVDRTLDRSVNMVRSSQVALHSYSLPNAERVADTIDSCNKWAKLNSFILVLCSRNDKNIVAFVY